MKIASFFFFFVLWQRGGKEYFAVLTASPLAESVQMESYCSVKIRAKTLTECSWFKSALISPSSMIENWWCEVVRVTASGTKLMVVIPWEAGLSTTFTASPKWIILKKWKETVVPSKGLFPYFWIYLGLDPQEGRYGTSYYFWDLQVQS